jgi:hypothetical protein
VGRTSAVKYRCNAARCAIEAERAVNPANKTFLLGLALAWLRLAELAEKNSRNDVVYETPSPSPMV